SASSPIKFAAGGITMLRWIALLLVAMGTAVGAQDYPSKPIVIVVPAAAGGPTDTLTRVLAQSMGNAIKSQFIIENAGGAGGIGSASYLCGLLFMSSIDAQFTQVPYKGTGPAMNDLVGGQVDFMCDQTTNTVPQIKSGNVKVYAVTTASRLPSLPEVPTLDEQGVKGF